MYRYDAFALAEILDETGRATTFVRDKNSRITGIGDGAGRNLTSTYDANGQATEIKDALGDVTSLDWNPRRPDVRDDRS